MDLSVCRVELSQLMDFSKLRYKVNQFDPQSLDLQMQCVNVIVHSIEHERSIHTLLNVPQSPDVDIDSAGQLHQVYVEFLHP